MTWPRRLSNVIGFDDAPFARADRSDVPLVGAVCSGTRLDVVVSAHVKRDGDDATGVMARLLRDPSLQHVRAVLLQGITVAGLNVIDVYGLARAAGVPVLVVMRRPPRMEKFFRALEKVPDPVQRRALVEAAGAPEPLRGVWVQRVGLTRAEAERVLERTTVHGNIPEPLRLAHLIAGGMTTGKSRGRA